MRKVIVAFNMTLDGYCDHTEGIADEELHQHYTDVLSRAEAIMYGRITYHLMQSYWPDIVKTPTGNKSYDEFARAIQDIPKIVFSHTLTDADPTITGWENVRLAKKSIKEEVEELRQEPGNYILAGSPGIIAALTNLKLIDEFQLCIHPFIVGHGLQLFRNIGDKVKLRLLKTKNFKSGVTTLFYEVA